MPLDETSGAEPAVIAARRIAATIKAWLAPDAAERVFDVSAGRLRRILPGDVMVLVRSRGAFFEAMIRALKENDIATAGADRLLLRDSLAAMDLVAVGRAALLPEDDLTLATALKSPLIGLDDDDLLAIAPGARRLACRTRLPRVDEPRFVAARAAARDVAQARARTHAVRLLRGAARRRRRAARVARAARPRSERRDRRIHGAGARPRARAGALARRLSRRGRGRRRADQARHGGRGATACAS